MSDAASTLAATAADAVDAAAARPPACAVPGTADRRAVALFGEALVAEQLARRTLGLGLARLKKPPAIWTDAQQSCASGGPAHPDGFAAKHAAIDRELAAAATQSARAERSMPAIHEAWLAGRIRESARRLAEQRCTPDAVDAWLAEAPNPRDRAATAGFHRLLDEACVGELPTDTRARLARAEAGEPTATDTTRYSETLRLDAWQHDAWSRAREKLSGEDRAILANGRTLALLLDFFGALDLGDATACGLPPAAFASLRLRHRVFICEVTRRAWLRTPAGRLEISVPDPADRACPITDPKVFIRNARGKSVSHSPRSRWRHFPETCLPAASSPAMHDEVARRVRALLGYPADQLATTPCPPRPPEQLDCAPDEYAEDKVPAALLRALDLAQGDLPFHWPAAVVRAVTASGGRAVHALRYRALLAFAGVERAVRLGTLPRATVDDIFADAGLSERTRHGWRQVWRALRRLPVLRAAFKRGAIGYTKVRELCRVVSPTTEAAWLRFARPRRLHVVEAIVRDTKPGDPPPAVPDGMEPFLPIGTRITEAVREPLTRAQWETLKRLRELVKEVTDREPDEAEVISTVAGWYLCLLDQNRGRKRRDEVIYQRSPEARVPMELRQAAAPKDRRQAGEDGGAALPFAWLRARGASLCSVIELPFQVPGQKHVPTEARAGVRDRDGCLCTVPYCWHDRGLQHNHGRRRGLGGIANILRDQTACQSDNDAHARAELFILNRPDGGVWCIDGAGRWHDTVQPVAQHLDRPLLRELLAAARGVITARSRGAPAMRAGPADAA